MPDDAALNHNVGHDLAQRPRSQDEAEFLRRTTTLGEAIQQSRRAWRLLYGRFWQLRHENTVRRPSWRVEMEAQAWKAMRAEVRRYGELRAQLHDLRSE
jgi:hypothetical protein